MYFRLFSLPPLIAATLALLPTVAQAAPPPNDNFANRMVLTGQAVSSSPVVINDATREGLERADTGKQTVWYSWTAPQDGVTTMTTAGTAYGARLEVFNGDTLPGLVEIDGNSGGPASITFQAKAGFTYQISIGSTFVNGESGSAVLNIINKPTTLTAPVVVGVVAGGNNNFGDAAVLSGPVVTGFAYPVEATREGQEPSYTGNSTVWWSWTAPSDAQVTMTTSGINFSAVLTVFNGTTLANIALVAGQRDSNAKVTFPTKAGTNYRICVGSINSTGNTSIINVLTSPLALTAPVIIESLAATNDNFSDAQDLGSSPVVTGFGFNPSATSENLEPSADGSRTLWWNWKAPQDGNLTVSTLLTDFSHYLNVSTGPSLAGLTSSNFGRANAGGDAGGTIPVTAGTLYHFAIGSSSSGTGTAVLSLSFAPGLSHVNLTADAPILHQSQASSADFTLSRDGDLSKIITVNYKESIQVDGYSRTLTGKKKIKAGKSSAKIKVDTSGYYNKATLKLTLTGGDGYVVGDAVKAKTKVYGN